MKKVLLFSLIFNTFSALWAQEDSISTIKLDTSNYQRTISYNNEELFEVLDDFDTYAITSINADSVLKFFRNKPRDVFGKKLYNDDEIKRISKTFEKYINKHFNKSNVLKFNRPNGGDFFDKSIVFNKPSVILYHIVRSYHSQAVKSGDLKIKLTSGEQIDNIDVLFSDSKEPCPTKGNCTKRHWSYFINSIQTEYYSYSEYDKIE